MILSTVEILILGRLRRLGVDASGLGRLSQKVSVRLGEDFSIDVHVQILHPPLPFS